MKKILTDVDVANLALGFLGEQKIESFSDGTDEAETMDLQFDQARKSLLELRRWSKARKRLRLTQNADAPAFGYDYSFRIPEDCLRVLAVIDSASGQPIRDFEIEGSDLLTDYKECALHYVRDLPVSEMSRLMVKGLSALLAAEVAVSLGESRMAPALAERAEDAIQDAWFADAQQTRSGENSDFIERSKENPVVGARDIH